MKFTVGNQISDNKSVKLDSAILADTRALICASSGQGKSHLLRLIAEQIGEKIQTILIDPEGEFPTLREGLDILIVGENGDIRPDIKSAGLLARRLVETGVSAVIDLYDLPGKGDPWDKRRLFTYAFLNGLMEIPKSLYHPMIVMIDEAHQIAPETPSKTGKELSKFYFKQDVSPSLLSRSAVRSVMSAGRKRGIGGILATQRVGKIDKDSIADCRNTFIGGTNLDLDQERAGDMLGLTKKESVTLRDLDPGVFFGFGPATGARGVVQFMSGEVKTTHPKAGQRSSIQVPPASTKIAAITEKLGDLPAEVQAEVQTMETLRGDVQRLERELRTRPVQEVAKPEIREVEKLIITNDQISMIGDFLADIRDMQNRFGTLKSEVDGAFQAANNGVAKLVPVLEDALKVARTPPRAPLSLPIAQKQEQKRAQTPNPEVSPVDGLSGPEQRILDAIAWFQSIGNFEPLQTAVAFLAGYTYGGGAFNNPRGSLRTKGLVEYKGDSICLTVAGQGWAKVPQSPLTVGEMQGHVLGILPGPEAKILAMLISFDGRPVEKIQLAELCEYKIGGAFNNPLGRLRSLGLIDYPGKNQARALPFLFLR